MNKFYAIRGATTIEFDTTETIKAASLELIETLLSQNKLHKNDLISLISTTTSDIVADYPVKFMRECGLLGEDMVYFSCLEPDIKNALKLCIRVLLHVQTDKPFKPVHAYLRGAKVLRKDLSAK